jgi:hypothetical protein
VTSSHSWPGGTPNPRATLASVETPGSRSTNSIRVIVLKSSPERLASSTCDMPKSSRIRRTFVATCAMAGSLRTNRRFGWTRLVPAASWP